jgi:hypothetical protein
MALSLENELRKKVDLKGLWRRHMQGRRQIVVVETETGTATRHDFEGEVKQGETAGSVVTRGGKIPGEGQGRFTIFRGEDGSEDQLDVQRI